MITLLSIEMVNFMCFGRVRIGLKDRGLVGVMGRNYDSTAASSNGSGKSAFFEAIHFALQGKTLRGLKVNEILRRGCAENGMVEAIFTDDKHNYAVRREFDTKGTGNLAFTRLDDGVDLVGENKKDTQKKIDQVLGMSSRMFKHVVLFGQGGSTRFSDLGDVGKKELVEEMLGLSVYERASTEARARARTHHNNLVMIRQGLEGLERTKVEVSKRISVLEDVKKQWEDGRAQQRQDLLDRKEVLEAELGKKGGTASDAIQKALDELEKALGEQDEVIKEGQIELSRVESKYREKLAEFQKQATSTEAELYYLRDKHERLDHMLFDGVCPTCGRPTDQDLKDQAAPLPHTILQLQVRLGKERQDIENLHAAYEGVETDIKGRMAEATRLKTKLTGEKGEKLAELRAADRNVARVCEELARLDEKIKRAESSVFAQQFELTESKKELSTVVHDIAVCQQEEKQVEVTSRKYAVLSKVFGSEGIRSFMFEMLLDGLNEKLREYSEIVSGGQLQVSISATKELVSGDKREKITVHVDNRSGGESYQSNSSGEQRRLDLPIAFALQDLAAQRGMGLGLCLMDEVFEHVDETGVEQVVSLLEHVSTHRAHTRSVFVVTHNEELKGAFPNVWLVTKDKGVAHIEGA